MKNRVIQIRADDATYEQIKYLKQLNGYKSDSDTIRKTIKKEFIREQPNAMNFQQSLDDEFLDDGM